MTKINVYARIAAEILGSPGECHTDGGGFLFRKGANFFNSLHVTGRERDNMENITLTDLLLIISAFIAFADLLLKHYNDRK